MCGLRRSISSSAHRMWRLPSSVMDSSWFSKVRRRGFVGCGGRSYLPPGRPPTTRPFEHPIRAVNPRDPGDDPSRCGGNLPPRPGVDHTDMEGSVMRTTVDSSCSPGWPRRPAPSRHRRTTGQATYPISDHPELSLITDDGQVRVVSWDRDADRHPRGHPGIRIGDGGVRITDEHPVITSRSRCGAALRLLVPPPLDPDRGLDPERGRPGRAHRRRQGDGSRRCTARFASTPATAGSRSRGSRATSSSRPATGRSRRATSTAGSTCAPATAPSASRAGLEELVIHSGDGNVEADVAKGSRVSEAWGVTTGDGDITPGSRGT